MTTLEQYYAYDMLRKQSMYRYLYKFGRIEQIKAFIRAGGDPLKSDEFKEDYIRLVEEFGPEIFIVTEDGNYIEPENKSDVVFV